MKPRTKSAVARDWREKAKIGGGSQADRRLDILQSAISSNLPQQIFSIGKEVADCAVLHGDLDITPYPDKLVIRITNWMKC